MTLKLKLFALATALMSTTPLFAADLGDAAPTRIVNVAGLDLASPAGQSIARGRIARAVKQVCQQDMAPDLMQAGAILRCRKVAIADAESQLIRYMVSNTGKGGIEVASLRR